MLDQRSEEEREAGEIEHAIVGLVLLFMVVVYSLQRRRKCRRPSDRALFSFARRARYPPPRRSVPPLDLAEP